MTELKISKRGRISSPRTFKTCYIAAVKERLGLLKRKRTRQRKVTPPQHLEPFIEQAIRKNPEATYQQLQEKALELYKKETEKALPFYGVLPDVSPVLLTKVLTDHESFYGVGE